MQDRYAGDMGDFGKFSLLRVLSQGRQLGVCWYRTDGAGELNNDGGHLRYLLDPQRFERLDPYVFGALGSFVEAFRANSGLRSVRQLEKIRLLPESTCFHGEFCPRGNATSNARRLWAARMAAATRGTQLLFLDPDNGLEGDAPNHKNVLLSELEGLRAPGRALLMYHHQTQRKGGAAAEFDYIRTRLQAQATFRDVVAVRLKPYSSRFYFLLDADAALRARFAAFAERWSTECVAFPVPAAGRSGSSATGPMP